MSKGVEKQTSPIIYGMVINFIPISLSPCQGKLGNVLRGTQVSHFTVTW